MFAYSALAVPMVLGSMRNAAPSRASSVVAAHTNVSVGGTAMLTGFTSSAHAGISLPTLCEAGAVATVAADVAGGVQELLCSCSAYTANTVPSRHEASAKSALTPSLRDVPAVSGSRSP